MKKLTLDATVENIEVVTEFVDRELEKMNCSIQIESTIDIAIDEVFANIANYAYKDSVGEVTVCFEAAEGNNAVITFIDSGIRYNPLEKEDPDITLSAEERQIGGLGIFIVKQTMDNVSYEYKDGKNILRIEKRVE